MGEPFSRYQTKGGGTPKGLRNPTYELVHVVPISIRRKNKNMVPAKQSSSCFVCVRGELANGAA